MSAREAFVLRAVEDGSNISALCREYGISRKTGYKWLSRYAEKGLVGLEDVSRRPQSSPLSVAAEVVVEVVRIRQTHRWGARKIAEVFRLEHPDLEPPSARTVHRILLRSGFLQPGRKRRRERKSNGPRSPPRVVAKQPNDVWTVDFKGWWLSMDKHRCEPLTIRDASSRFILRIEVLSSTLAEPVRRVFAEVFRKYGLPKAILTDNGPPWVTTHGELGLTQLSAWWTSLGIEHIRTRPGQPSDNGGHERMHRDMAEELEAYAELTQERQQQACERFRHDFNSHRPHEALKMKRPAELYRRSEVRFVDAPAEPEYPEGFMVRRVGKRGAITLHARPLFISWALQHQYIGLQRTGTHTLDVWYFHKRIGELNTKEHHPKLKPVDWKETSVLLPKAA